jgi:tRNA (cmo5U34)-methyltransferase
MALKDNTTAHPSQEYDSQIRATIPYYDAFHKEAINLVRAIISQPERWLDTGCGTGSLVIQAMETFPRTQFILADPAPGMVEIARTKLSGKAAERIHFLEPVASQDIDEADIGRVDVVTAIQCHHYLKAGDRWRATLKCFHLLKPGGLYITFENTRPSTERGVAITKAQWADFQRASGKDPATVKKHMERYNTEYFPITIAEHLCLLKECGFETAELFWFSCMQAGFYAMK